MLTAIVVAVLLLAYANGANDNFKGVATLFGSDTASYRRALAWGTLTTFAGSSLALLVAQGLLETFQGRTLVPEALTVEPAFRLAVSLGAALTILLATWTGIPISTTHALTGALVGAGWLATGGAIRFAALMSSFVVPLLLSPFLAMLLAIAIYPVFNRVCRGVGITREGCLCVGSTDSTLRPQRGGTLIVASSGITVQAGVLHDCVARYQGRMLGLDAGAVLDAAHYLSAGAVGLARGLNDTPKIVALLLATREMPSNVGLALVAIVMAVGGILSARPVAKTMGRGIVSMDPGEGFSANLVTSLLVTVASRFGLPVSTTHVSVGALFGIGTLNGTARRRAVATIMLAWITTLPAGALFAAAGYWSLRALA